MFLSWDRECSNGSWIYLNLIKHIFLVNCTKLNGSGERLSSVMCKMTLDVSALIAERTIDKGGYTESIQCLRPRLKERQHISCKTWVKLCLLAVSSVYLLHITCSDFSSAIGRNIYCFDCTVFSLWHAILVWKNLLVLFCFFSHLVSAEWVKGKWHCLGEEDWLTSLSWQALFPHNL